VGVGEEDVQDGGQGGGQGDEESRGLGCLYKADDVQIFAQLEQM
jgi:hypothetical protein